MSEIWTVYHQDADSYNSRPELPIAAFDSEDKAIEFAKGQDGYGYGADWFVRSIPLNPRWPIKR